MTDHIHTYPYLRNARMNALVREHFEVIMAKSTCNNGLKNALEGSTRGRLWPGVERLGGAGSR